MNKKKILLIIFMLLFCIGIGFGIKYAFDLVKEEDNIEEIKDDDEFHFNGKEITYYEGKLSDFYSKYYNYLPEKIESHKDENKNLIIKAYDSELEDTYKIYTIEKGKAIAKDQDGKELDLENQEFIEKLVEVQNIDFNGKLLAIDYFDKTELNNKLEKYGIEKNSIKELDRGGNKCILVIPKILSSNLTIKSCYYSQFHDLYETDTLLKKTNGIILITTKELNNKAKISLDYEYYSDIMLLPFELNDDGKINLRNYDTILDLTEYK